MKSWRSKEKKKKTFHSTHHLETFFLSILLRDQKPFFFRLANKSQMFFSWTISCTRLPDKNKNYCWWNNGARRRRNITHSDTSLKAQWHKGNENKETRKGIKCLENKNKNFIEFIYFVKLLMSQRVGDMMSSRKVSITIVQLTFSLLVVRENK